MNIYCFTSKIFQYIDCDNHSVRKSARSRWSKDKMNSKHNPSNTKYHNRQMDCNKGKRMI